MIETGRFDRARWISLDFDGVLSTLVLGRTWEKTRDKARPGLLGSPLVRGFKTFFASLTEWSRKPLPQAEGVLRRLRSSQKTLCVLTSRTGERITAAERWLDKYAWGDMFDQLFFNTESEDADQFKAKILRTYPIDIHIDDDPETLSHLSRLFPEKVFVHMDVYRRKIPEGDNIVVVRTWDEIAGLFSSSSGS
jgi:uncharacterized HAD superfamily protein